MKVLRTFWPSGFLLSAVEAVILGVLVLFLQVTPACCDQFEEGLSLLASRHRGSVGLAFVDIGSKQPLFSYQSRKPLKPASVMKLLTSSLALSELGPDFRFETEVHTSRLGEEGSIEHLVVRGGGDPNFRTEDMWILARTLFRRGVRKVGTLHLDTSHFQGLHRRSGQRAYETGSSALTLNYNSVLFSVCPNPGGKAYVMADPWEAGFQVDGAIKTVSGTSKSYSIEDVSSNAGPQKFRVSGRIGSARDCGEFYRSVRDPVSYFGSTLRGFLEHLGVSVSSIAPHSTGPAGVKKFYTHKSKALSQIVEDLNHYSTNVIAEQILFYLGGSGGELRRDKGIDRLRQYAKDLAGSDPITVVDASGLSHDNRLTASTVANALVSMHYRVGKGIEFQKSLSVAGRSGTLKRRLNKSRGMVVRGKTGSLNGVASLAGYLRTEKGSLVAFVIIQNGISSPSAAWKFEQELLDLVYRGA